MKYDIPAALEAEIIGLAQKNNILKIILFGSRAKGNNTERSDIDLAVSGGSIDNFTFQLDNDADTLLMFDIVDLDKPITDELSNEIKKYGVTIYEKI